MARVTALQTTATAGPGIVGKLLFYLGFVPSSQFKPLSTQVADLQAQLAQLQSANAALQAQLSQLTTEKATLLAQAQSLESQIGQEDGVVASLMQQVSNDQATISSLKTQIAADEAQITSLGNDIASKQAQIAAIESSITGVLANPRPVSSSSGYSKVMAQFPNGLTDSDCGLLGGDLSIYNQDLGSGSADLTYPESTYVWDGTPTFAYAPGTVGYSSGYQGLGTSSGSILTHATPRFQTTGSGIGSRLATAFGYIPVADVTDEQAQIAYLTGQIGTAQTQGSALSASIASAQSDVAQLTSRVNGDQSALSNLQNQASNLASEHQQNLTEISALQSEHQGYLTQISGLTSRDNALTSELAAWKAGGFPVTFAWTWPDGTTSPLSSPNKGFNTPGGYLGAKLTVTVVTPDGKTWTKTFQLPELLLGQWPASVKISGGGASTSGTVNAQFFDEIGNPIAGMRVWHIARNPIGGVTSHGVAATDGQGYVRYDYYGAGEVRIVAVRNPRVNGKSGLAVL